MKLQTTGESLLPAVAYGDATGLPFETKAAMPVGSIEALPSLIENTFLTIPEDQRDTVGIWSDDSHLSLASALSLIRSGGFDLHDQALAQVEAYAHVQGDQSNPDLIPPIVTADRKNGYGGSTVKSLGRLARGISPYESGEQDGAGNGVLMKLAPLVYWQATRHVNGPEAIQQVTDFTRMTHAAPEAIVSSQVYRSTLLRLLEWGYDKDDPAGFYADAIADAERFEKVFDPAAKTSTVLKRLEDAIVHGHQEAFTQEMIVAAAEQKGFYAPETLLMAYASFVLEPDSPQSVYRAAELGGDSDSVASVVAVLSTFNTGRFEAPDLGEVFAVERLKRVSAELTKLCLSS
jgi:ADP-ribosylglycohydrolase